MSLNIELFPLVGRPPAVTYLVSYRRHLTSSSVLKINNLSLLILNHPNYFEPTVSLQYCPFYVANQIIGLSFNIV